MSHQVTDRQPTHVVNLIVFFSPCCLYKYLNCWHLRRVKKSYNSRGTFLLVFFLFGPTRHFKCSSDVTNDYFSFGRPEMVSRRPCLLALFVLISIYVANTNCQCFTVESSDSAVVALRSGVLATDQLLSEIPEGTYVKDLGLNLCGSAICSAGWRKVSHKGASGYER